MSLGAIPLLRALFALILVSMLGVACWASLDTPLFGIPRTVVSHPWFIATLLDAYWAFISFYLWVAWKEQSAAARLLWFVAILALGNIAMSSYILRELARIREPGGLTELFTQRRTGNWLLPAALSVAGVLVYLLAWQTSAAAPRGATMRAPMTAVAVTAA